MFIFFSCFFPIVAKMVTNRQEKTGGGVRGSKVEELKILVDTRRDRIRREYSKVLV